MKKWIDKNIGKIVLILFLLGPIFDLCTSISIHIFHISLTWITGIKILFLFLLIFNLQFNSKCRYKKILLFILYTIILYMVLYAGMIFTQKGTDVFLYECQNMIRTFFFPISLIGLYSLKQEKKLSIEWKHFYIVFMSYLILILIPLLTKTGFNSYAYSKTGSIGWFYSANEIGGILSILLPFFFLQMKHQRKAIALVLFLIIGFVFCSMGTKVPILSLGLVLCGLLCYQLYQLAQAKKWKPILFVLLGCFLLSVPLLLVIPKTSFYQNIKIHLEFLDINTVSDLLSVEHIDHFIYSERITFLESTMNNYQNAPMIEKILGIGYIENYGTDELNMKMIEMDYYDVFFRHGILGSILYFLPMLGILVSFIKKKRNICVTMSMLVILLLSLFSGHILIAPSVSMIVALILIQSLQEGCI